MLAVQAAYGARPRLFRTPRQHRQAASVAGIAASVAGIAASVAGIAASVARIAAFAQVLRARSDQV